MLRVRFYGVNLYFSIKMRTLLLHGRISFSLSLLKLTSIWHRFQRCTKELMRMVLQEHSMYQGIFHWSEWNHIIEEPSEMIFLWAFKVIFSHLELCWRTSLSLQFHSSYGSQLCYQMLITKLQCFWKLSNLIVLLVLFFFH